MHNVNGSDNVCKNQQESYLHTYVRNYTYYFTLPHKHNLKHNRLDFVKRQFENHNS